MQKVSAATRSRNIDSRYIKQNSEGEEKIYKNCLSQLHMKYFKFWRNENFQVPILLGRRVEVIACKALLRFESSKSLKERALVANETLE